MLYLGTSPCEPAVADLLDRRRLGLMVGPGSNEPKVGWLWAADNGCFSSGWEFARWRAWFQRDRPRSGCLFAAVPDVVGDAAATLEQFDIMASFIRYERLPVALVAQDGLERLDVPWDEFDCLFIGGSTEWKLSEHARNLAGQARERGKWVHVGRVNSERRFRGLASMADSCDGTFLAFGPTQNTPRLLRWLDNHDANPQLDLEPA